MKVCINCGKELNGELFCVNCGTKVSDEKNVCTAWNISKTPMENDTDVKNEHIQKSKHTLRNVIICIIAAVIIAGCSIVGTLLHMDIIGVNSENHGNDIDITYQEQGVEQIDTDTDTYEVEVDDSDFDATNTKFITFQAQNNLTNSEMDIAKEIFEKRLGKAGYETVKVSNGDNNTLIVKISTDRDLIDIVWLLNNKGLLTLADADGKVWLDSNTDVKNASYQYSEVSNGSSQNYFVCVDLNKMGRQKFNKLTENASKMTDGKNFVKILMDDLEISEPRVSDEMVTDSFVVNCDFTKEEAMDFAAIISSGPLPCDFKEISME